MTVFEIVFHLSHELIRRRPINDPVVERQAKIPHRSNGDRIVDDDGSFLNCADTQNGDLRLMDDRGAEQAAESAMIRDRERSILNLFGINFLDLARSARSAISFANWGSPFRSAYRTTGTKSPSSSAVAIPIWISFLTTMPCSPHDEFTIETSRMALVAARTTNGK